MNFAINNPPREFEVGVIHLKDCAHITLEPDEQVTFLTKSGAEYDVVRKDWGFYATPSLNGRLERFNLRGALVKSCKSQYFIMLIERGKETLFQQYLDMAQLNVLCWLDNTQAVERVEHALRSF